MGGEAIEVADSQFCPFICQAGYLKTDWVNSLVRKWERSCTLPPFRKYVRYGYHSDPNNPTGSWVEKSSCKEAKELEKECVVIVVDCKPIPNGHFLPPKDPVLKGKCPFACNIGFVKNETDRTCTKPEPGYFADSDGDRQKCTTEKGEIDDVDEIGGFNQVGYELSDPALCRFSCVPGSIPDFNGRRCLPTLGKGKFVDSHGQEGDCGAVSPQDQGVGWAPKQPVSVQTAAECEFACAAHRTFKRTLKTDGSDGRICDPDSGYYVIGGLSNNSRAATPCTNGTVPNDAKDGCRDPRPGYFALRVDGIRR